MEIVDGMELWGGPLDGSFVSEAFVEHARAQGSVVIGYRLSDLRPLGSAQDANEREHAFAEYKLELVRVRGVDRVRLEYQRA